MSDTAAKPRSEHSYPTGPPDADDRERPRSPRDLVEFELRPGDIAVRRQTPGFFLVLRRAAVPAGSFPVDAGGTLDEWIDCDADADVLVAVDLTRLEEVPGTFGSADDVLEAVRDGRLFSRGLPADWLVPALEEFVEARRAGEWSGAADYVRGELHAD